MDFSNAHRERQLKPQRFLSFGFASLAAHALLFSLLLLWMGKTGAEILVLGPKGEGGEPGKGDAIQVGVVGSEVLDFNRHQPNVAYSGDNKNDKINNERQQHYTKPEDDGVPAQSKQKIDQEARQTNLAVHETDSRLWTRKVQKASSDSRSANMGMTGGSARPVIQARVGIGDGTGSGFGKGFPNGSEYGRRIQSILSRNFTPPNIPVNGVIDVVIYVKITRDGHITSVIGGRVPPNYFKQRSPYEQLNFAAERAIVATAAQGLPSFPSDLLSNVSEAVAEVWFQYP
jgi:hypothetical protein